MGALYTPAMLRQRALELIERAQKRARLSGPAQVGGQPRSGLAARLQREREAADAEPPVVQSPADGAERQLEQQLGQLRQQHAGTQFAEAAAMALATRLAAAERGASAPGGFTSPESDAVLGAIHRLQQSREFHRLRFAAQFLSAVGGMPTLPTVWRLHITQVVPLEQLLEAASGTAQEHLTQAIYALVADELRVGRDGAHAWNAPPLTAARPTRDLLLRVIIPKRRVLAGSQMR